MDRSEAFFQALRPFLSFFIWTMLSLVFLAILLWPVWRLLDIASGQIVYPILGGILVLLLLSFQLLGIIDVPRSTLQLIVGGQAVGAIVAGGFTIASGLVGQGKQLVGFASVLFLTSLVIGFVVLAMDATPFTTLRIRRGLALVSLSYSLYGLITVIWAVGLL